MSVKNLPQPAGNTGEIQFNNAGIFGGDSNLFWDNSAKQLGIGTTTPSLSLQIIGSLAINDNALNITNKFNSQGVSIANGQNNIFLNGGAAERPEISWIRGARSYPEASIREHTTQDQGLEFWTGNGTIAPSLTMSLARGSVGIGTGSPSDLLHVYDPTASARMLVDSGTIDAYMSFASAGTIEWTIGNDSSQSDNFAIENADFITDDPEFAIQKSTGNVGIGTGSPTQKLQIASGNADLLNGFLTWRKVATQAPAAGTVYSNTAGHLANLQFIRGRGTDVSPLAIQSGDSIGALRFVGYYDASSIFRSSEIVAKASENWGASNRGTKIEFYSTADGTTSRTLRMVLAGNGFLGLGTATQVSRLEVNGSIGKKVTTLNAATLTLDETHDFVSVVYTATGAVSITLPSATSSWNSTDGIGRTYTISDSAANAGTFNITINRAGADTIVDTATAQTSTIINGDGDTIRLTAINSTTWKVW